MQRAKQNRDEQKKNASHGIEISNTTIKSARQNLIMKTREKNNMHCIKLHTRAYFNHIVIM